MTLKVAILNKEASLLNLRLQRWLEKGKSMASAHSHNQTVALKDLPGPRGIPFFGNARQIVPHRMQQLEDWAKQFGHRYKITLGSRQILVCSNPDDILAALKNRPAGFRRTSRLEMISKEFQMTGVFSANGEEWRRQRAFVMMAFNPQHIKAYFLTLRLVTERLFNRWLQQSDSAASFELEPSLMRVTIDVTAGLAFRTDINTIESDGVVIQQHLKEIFRMLQKRLFAPFPYWHWIKFSADRAIDKSIVVVAQSVREFIDAARQKMKQDPVLFSEPTNLLEAMLAAQNQSEAALSESELAGNILTMLLAGEDTTAHSLAWLIYLLSKHPEFVLRVRSEVDNILGDEPIPSQHAQLHRMDFLEACIHESMRLHPVAPIIGSEAVEEVIVAGTTIPKGTMILFVPRVAAVGEGNFSHATDFMPDRWAEPVSESNNKKVSIPFGAGPRMCPGRFLAIEEMKMVIAVLVKNFDIERIDTPDGGQAQEYLTFTMGPAGLRIKLRRRQN